MKRIFIAMFWATVSNSLVSAQVLPDYKAWHINQNFDGIAAFNGATPILGVTGETLPAGWSFNGTNNNYFTGGSISSYFVDRTDSTLFNAINWLGSGSGGRGGELRFPSTSTSVDADSAIWYVEFDWTSRNAGFGYVDKQGRNCIGLMLSGSNSKNFSDGEKAGDTWYGDSFFLLYAYKPDTLSDALGGPGSLHLVNLDPVGEPYTVNITDDNGDVIGKDTVPGAFYRPFHALGGSDVARFRRAGMTWIEADSLNLSTKTNVLYRDKHTFHIKVKLNMHTQIIEEFTITQKDSTANSQTLTNIPFLAKYLAGRNSAVAEADRVITDISRIEGFSLRTTQLGAGDNSAHDYLIDNLEVYVMKPSKGVEDVTISYIDRDGMTAKPARIETGQQVGFNISLQTSDKQRFEDDNYYYAYDEAATHTANAALSEDGESLEVVKDASNILYVVFKKSVKQSGTYVWKGASSVYWSELEDNFSVNSGAPTSYQVGNPVAFSDESIVNKEVAVDENVDLQEGSLTISAPDYILSGTGSLIGTDTIYLNAPTTIAMNASPVKGGAILNVQEVTLKALTPVSNIEVKQDNSVIKIDAPSGTLSLNIEGQGGTLNYEAGSNTIYSVKTNNVSTINVLLKTSGARSSNYWSGTSASVPNDAQLNVTTDVENSIMPVAFATNLTMMDSTRVHLGDNIRVIHHANEAAAGSDRQKIGELTGSATSYLEGGFVDGRAFGYEIGSLGTDAVFDGSIRPWLSKVVQGAIIDENTMERYPDSLVWGRSGLRLDKVGEGKWTVNGTVTFPAVSSASMYNYIYVKQGTLALNNKVYFSDYIAKTAAGADSAIVASHAITVYPAATLILKDSLSAPAVNRITLKVDTTATLETNNNFVGANIIDVLGRLKGGLTVPNSISFYDKATVSLNVNSFDEGDYDVIYAAGDVTVIGSVLNITVKSATADASIPMIKSMGNMDLSFSQILVNGVDITDNTPETEGAEFVWYFDEGANEGVLLSKTTFASAIDHIAADKTTREIQYFDVLGRRIYSESKGLVIKKIIYDDNTFKVQKSFIDK
jgi:hypothetical protein